MNTPPENVFADVLICLGSIHANALLFEVFTLDSLPLCWNSRFFCLVLFCFFWESGIELRTVWFRGQKVIHDFHANGTCRLLRAGLLLAVSGANYQTYSLELQNWNDRLDSTPNAFPLWHSASVTQCPETCGALGWLVWMEGGGNWQGKLRFVLDDQMSCPSWSPNKWPPSQATNRIDKWQVLHPKNGQKQSAPLPASKTSTGRRKKSLWTGVFLLWKTRMKRHSLCTVFLEECTGVFNRQWSGSFSRTIVTINSSSHWLTTWSWLLTTRHKPRQNCQQKCEILLCHANQADIQKLWCDWFFSETDTPRLDHFSTRLSKLKFRNKQKTERGKTQSLRRGSHTEQNGLAMTELKCLPY